MSKQKGAFNPHALVDRLPNRSTFDLCPRAMLVGHDRLELWVWRRLRARGWRRLVVLAEDFVGGLVLALVAVLIAGPGVAVSRPFGLRWFTLHQFTACFDIFNEHHQVLVAPLDINETLGLRARPVYNGDYLACRNLHGNAMFIIDNLDAESLYAETEMLATYHFGS